MIRKKNGNNTLKNANNNDESDADINNNGDSDNNDNSSGFGMSLAKLQGKELLHFTFRGKDEANSLSN